MAENVIKARVVFDTKGLQGAGIPATGGSKGGGGGVGLAGAGALAGAVSAGVTALLGVIKKGFGKLVEASPKLQQTFSIFGKAFMLLLRPIGDIIAGIFRPMAIALLRWVIDWYREIKEPLAKLIDILTAFFGKEQKDGEAGAGGAFVGGPGVGAEGTLTKAITTFFDNIRKEITETNAFGTGLVATFRTIVSSFEFGTGVLLTLWGALKIIWAVIEIVTKLFLALLEVALKPLLPFIEAMSRSLVALGEFFSQVGDAMLALAEGDFTAFFEIIKNAWSNFRTAIEEIQLQFVEDMKVFWSGLFLDLLNGALLFGAKILEGLQGVWDSIVRAVMNVKDKVAQLGSEMAALISKAISKIKSFFSRDKESGDRKAVGGFLRAGTTTLVGERGPELLRSGTGGVITPTNQLGGGSNNVTINISAMDAGSFDTRMQKKIAEVVAVAMRRGLSGRTTEGIGAF